METLLVVFCLVLSSYVFFVYLMLILFFFHFLFIEFRILFSLVLTSVSLAIQEKGFLPKIKKFLESFLFIEKNKILLTLLKKEQGFVNKKKTFFLFIKNNPGTLRPFFYFCFFKALKGFFVLFFIYYYNKP